MKICPQCRTTYTDDTLQYCLQDGTPLTSQNVSQSWTEAETLVTPRNPSQYQTTPSHTQSQTWTQEAAPNTATTPQKKNTALIVVLTALITILAVGVGVIGLMLYKRGQNSNVAQNNNVKNTNTTPANANANRTPNANAGNANTNASTLNANANTTPTATPTPKPTLDPKQSEEIKSKVKNTIEDWRDSTEQLDMAAVMSNYADTVDYYNAGKVGRDRVQSDKKRAFEIYDDVSINMDNWKITVDPSGEKATVLFDKKWDFKGVDKESTGKVLQQLQLAKINGRWLIVGEKDIKNYNAKE